MDLQDEKALESGHQRFHQPHPQKQMETPYSLPEKHKKVMNCFRNSQTLKYRPLINRTIWVFCKHSQIVTQSSHQARIRLYVKANQFITYVKGSKL